jgi:hypothetical protein
VQRGIAVLAGTAVGTICYLLPGLVVWIWGIIDARRLAEQVNDGRLPYVRMPSPMLAMQFVGGIGIIVFSVFGFLMLAFGAGGYG